MSLLIVRRGLQGNRGASGEASAESVIVANNIAAVNSVATSIANINAVATNIGGINTVVTDIADVATVADRIADVRSVASSATNVNSVGSSITSVNTVADRIADVSSVASNATNVNSVGSSITSVNTVASNNTNVTTVATNMPAVTTVATNIPAVTTVATNITDILAVEELAQAAEDASTQAIASAASAAASAAQGMYNNVVSKKAPTLPFAPALAEEGYLFRIDTSGGNFVINLPSLAATYNKDMKFAFVKVTNDSNTVTINMTSPDKINGVSFLVFDKQWETHVIIGDKETATWIDCVQSSSLADGSVTTAKLANGAVVEAKIGTGAVTTDKLSTTGVTAGTYTNPTVQVDSKGRIVSASNGTPSGPVIILEQTVPGSANITLTDVFNSGFKEYEVHLENFIPFSDDNHLIVRVGNGASIHSAANYSSTYMQSYVGGGNSNGRTGLTSWELIYGISNNESAGGVSAIIKVLNPTKTDTYKHWFFRAACAEAGTPTQCIHADGGMVYAATTALTTLQIYFGAGDISSGTVRVIGIK